MTAESVSDLLLFNSMDTQDDLDSGCRKIPDPSAPTQAKQ